MEPVNSEGSNVMGHNKEAEQLIRERAFQIWIEQGQLEGHHEEHWQQAEAELASGTDRPSSSGPVGMLVQSWAFR
jgi:hypothetical protein